MNSLSTAPAILRSASLSSVSKAHETLDIKVEDALKRMFAKIGNF